MNPTQTKNKLLKNKGTEKNLDIYSISNTL